MKVLLALVSLAVLEGCANMRCSFNFPSEEYHQCMIDEGQIKPNDDDVFCIARIKAGEFETRADCDDALEHPDEYKCVKDSKSKAESDKCLWRLANPIEASCEDQDKEHGGYWECVRIGKEEEYRKATISERRRMHQDQMDEQQRERSRRDWKDIGESLQRTVQPPYTSQPTYQPPASPSPTTTCTSTKVPYSNQVQTVCH